MNTAAIETKELPADGLTQAQLMSDPFGDNAAQQSTQEDDRKLHVRFYIEPVYQEAESIIKERKIYADTEFIEIRIPGDKQTCIQRQVFPADRQRFPQHYARFKQGLADQTVGTLLSSLPSIPESKIKEYEFFHIKTVEQLADCADNASAAAIMGFAGDKQKARKFLDIAAGQAPVEELKKQIEERDVLLKQMRDQMAAQNERLAALEADQAKAPAKTK